MRISQSSETPPKPAYKPVSSLLLSASEEKFTWIISLRFNLKDIEKIRSVGKQWYGSKYLSTFVRDAIIMYLFNKELDSIKWGAQSPGAKYSELLDDVVTGSNEVDLSPSVRLRLPISLEKIFQQLEIHVPDEYKSNTPLATSLLRRACKEYLMSSLEIYQQCLSQQRERSNV